MIALTVNGVRQEIDVHPAQRLADVLRDRLQLKGTKIGCNAGDCGACTVRIDGHAACACITAVGQADGCAIQTVEGLAADPLGAKLQAAFHTCGAAQCGICTPGMLIAAHDLLAHKPHPTRAQIADALGGVLCRCTGYQKIFEAVEHCAAGIVESGETLGHIGARLPKTDGMRKINGSELFGADAIPVNARWLRLIRSPHHHARFVFGDLQAFAHAHGLDRILIASDVPSNGYGIYPTIKDQPVFAQGDVKFLGEAVCALVGEREIVEALDASALPITWEPLPALFGIDASESARDAVHLDKTNNVLIDGKVVKTAPQVSTEAHPRGAPLAGIAAARRANIPAQQAYVLEQTALQASSPFIPAAQISLRVQSTFVEHAYIEPEAGWAQRVGDRLEIHVTTQTPYMDRDEVAVVMRMSPSNVRIVPTACGGGFGGKLDMSVQPALAVAAWLLPDRPVACVYTRTESMASTTKRHPADIVLTMSADETGKLQHCETHAKFDTGAYASWGPTVATRVPIHATGPYFVPSVSARGTAYFTHCHPSGAFRGFGVPQGAIAHEAAMDGLADELKMDRLAFRLRNAIRVGDATATGQVLKDSAGLDQCLVALQERWTTWQVETRLFNQHCAAGKYPHSVTRRGVGIGCMWYGIGNTSLSNPSSMRIVADARGITLYSGAVDIGQGSNTILTQIAADTLQIPAAQIALITGDTDFTLDAGKTSASRQTYVSGKAVELAAKDLRGKLLRACDLEGEISAAQFSIHPDPNGATLHIHIADKTHSLPLTAAFEGFGRFDPPTTPQDANGQGEPYACYAFAAQIAMVEVDLELGTTKVLRVAAAHDVGRAINPTQVEGQIHGGILQGLGLALMEAYVPGRTENLHDYLIPTIGDMPEMEVILIEDPTALGPSGAKGVGEPGLIPTAPAILGAIEQATGVRMSSVPVLPHRLRAAILKAAQ
jgi:aldehyde oxidoreductase